MMATGTTDSFELKAYYSNELVEFRDRFADLEIRIALVELPSGKNRSSVVFCTRPDADIDLPQEAAVLVIHHALFYQPRYSLYDVRPLSVKRCHSIGWSDFDVCLFDKTVGAVGEYMGDRQRTIKRTDNMLLMTSEVNVGKFAGALLAEGLYVDYDDRMRDLGIRDLRIDDR